MVVPHRSDLVTTVRGALIVIGLAAGGYGAILVFDFSPRTIVAIGVWSIAGLVVHDFVFAPISAVLGWAGRRLVPRIWWAPIAIAALCSAVVVLLAIPVYTAPGARPDNPTVLDRNYPLGLWVSLAVIWVCVPLRVGVGALLSRRSREPTSRL